MKVEYIDNKPQNGIKYDYGFLRKVFRGLKIPKDVYDPTHLPFEHAKWFLTMSERSRGKTTNLLLFGLCIWWYYHTPLCYIRSRESMIMPKVSKDLFSGITMWGYIEKLTDGEYNGLLYKSRRWFLCYRNEDGIIEKQQEDACCLMLSIDKNEDYKSVLVTNSDFLLFDEFIEHAYYPNQFILLCDLIKTIARDRQSVMICLASNTIDNTSPYFYELEIAEQVENMTQGESTTITTERGTSVFVEILGKKPPKSNKRQRLLNKLYYGFSDPKLVSITGDATWSMDNYPHTPNKYEVIQRKRYVRFKDKLIAMDLCASEDGVLFIHFHLATRTYPDSIIYSLNTDNLDYNNRYGLGFTKEDKKLFKDFKDRGLFRYANNTIGTYIDAYYKEYDAKKKGR